MGKPLQDDLGVYRPMGLPLIRRESVQQPAQLTVLQGDRRTFVRRLRPSERAALQPTVEQKPLWS